jgi:hypothetical protein
MKKQIRKRNAGVVIIEALWVYPTIFVILAFCFYLCDLYFQRAWLDTTASTYATQIANQISDPAAGNGISGDTYAGTSDGDTRPYRYILVDDFATIKSNKEAELGAKVASGGASILGVRPKASTVTVSRRADRGGLSSQIIVNINYTYNFPIFSMFMNSNTFDVSSSSGALSTASSIGEKIRVADQVSNLSAAIAKGESPWEVIKTFIDRMKG